MNEAWMLKIDMGTAHINRTVCGNSFGVPCANVECTGTAFGTHPYLNIAAYCGECLELIKHAQSKASRLKKAGRKFRGYGRKK